MVIHKFVFVNGYQSLLPLQGGDWNIPLRLGAFVLTSHLQKERILLNMEDLCSSDYKPLSSLCLLCPLQYLFQYWNISTANKV